MTAFAGHHRVQTQQRKTCQIVVEHHVAIPRCRAVTGCAVGAKSRVMHIVLGMAPGATRRGLVRRFARLVAIRAIRLGMRSRQGELAVLVVIEP